MNEIIRHPSTYITYLSKRLLATQTLRDWDQDECRIIVHMQSRMSCEDLLREIELLDKEGLFLTKIGPTEIWWNVSPEEDRAETEASIRWGVKSAWDI